MTTRELIKELVEELTGGLIEELEDFSTEALELYHQVLVSKPSLGGRSLNPRILNDYDDGEDPSWHNLVRIYENGDGGWATSREHKATLKH